MVGSRARRACFCLSLSIARQGDLTATDRETDRERDGEREAKRGRHMCQTERGQTSHKQRVGGQVCLLSYLIALFREPTVRPQSGGLGTGACFVQMIALRGG